MKKILLMVSLFMSYAVCAQDIPDRQQLETGCLHKKKLASSHSALVDGYFEIDKSAIEAWGTMLTTQTMQQIPMYQKTITYPYTAPIDRINVILKNMNQLKKGIYKNNVISLLGNPDQVNPTYGAIKNGKQTGSSFVYLLEQRAQSGSVLQKNEKLIRIHFDNNGKLIWAYAMRIPSFLTIGK